MARKNAATRDDLKGSFESGLNNEKFQARPDADDPKRHENTMSGYPLTRRQARGPAARKNAQVRMPTGTVKRKK